MSQPIALSVCVLAISGTLSTCEDDQAAARREAAAPETAAAQYRLTAGVAAAPGGDAFASRRTELENLLRQAQSIPEAEGGPTGAKGLLVASIQRELAAMELAEASALSSGLALEREIVHALIDAGQRLAAHAEGRRSLDLSEARTRLTNQREQVVAMQQQATDVVGELEPPIQTLTAEIEADKAEVDRLIQESNQLRAEAMQLGPSQGFPRFEQAVSLERQADRFQSAIALREIDLDFELRPSRELAQHRIDTARAMLESIGRSESSLDAFQQLIRNDAQATDGEVEALADRIARRIDDLQSKVAGSEGTLLGHYESAAERLDAAARQAATAVRQLDGNDAAAARLAEARAHAQLGRTHWAKAASLLDHQVLLARLASADAVLPDTSGHRQRLAEVNTMLAEAVEGATQAYTSAQSSLGQVSFRGSQVGDANVALGAFKSAVDEALEALGPEGGAASSARDEAASGEGDPAASERMPPAESGGDASGSAPGAMSPQAMLQRLKRLEQSMDGARTMIALTHAPDEGAREAMEASLAMIEAIEQIRTAYEGHYGTSMRSAEQITGAMQEGLPSFDNATVETQGDDGAVIRYTDRTGQVDEMPLVRVNGRWFIAGETGATAAEAEQVRRMSEAMVGLAGDIVPKIRSGELGDAQAAEQVIGQRLMQVMMSMMGSGG